MNNELYVELEKAARRYFKTNQLVGLALWRFGVPTLAEATDEQGRLLLAEILLYRQSKSKARPKEEKPTKPRISAADVIPEYRN